MRKPWYKSRLLLILMSSTVIWTIAIPISILVKKQKQLNKQTSINKTQEQIKNEPITITPPKMI